MRLVCPAENAAIKNGIPPADWTRDNIAYMRGQMQRLGFGIDWSRNSPPVIRSTTTGSSGCSSSSTRKAWSIARTPVVNWDPVDQTVLANEQVVDGRGWRSGALVERSEDGSVVF